MRLCRSYITISSKCIGGGGRGGDIVIIAIVISAGRRFYHYWPTQFARLVSVVHVAGDECSPEMSSAADAKDPFRCTQLNLTHTGNSNSKNDDDYGGNCTALSCPIDKRQLNSEAQRLRFDCERAAESTRTKPFRT